MNRLLKEKHFRKGYMKGAWSAASIFVGPWLILGVMFTYVWVAWIEKWNIWLTLWWLFLPLFSLGMWAYFKIIARIANNRR